jgi:hypothetical protein
MIVGSQPEREAALQRAGAPVFAASAIKRHGSRSLPQVVVRFHSDVIFQVPVRYEFETQLHETLPPVLSEAGLLLAIV